MWIAVIIAIVVSAHFSLTPFAPAAAGKGSFYWPFAADSKPLLGFIGGLPSQAGSIVTPLLAGVAGLCLLAAALSLFGWVVPAGWFRPLVLAGCTASVLLYALYFGLNSLIPIALDAVLLFGLLALNWSVPILRG